MSRGLVVLAVACLSLVVVGTAFAARPRSVGMAIGGPSVQQSSKRATGDQEAVLLGDCFGSPIGVVTQSEALIRKGARADLSLPSSSAKSVVVAEKGWFGGYQFHLVAADGTRIELEPTSRFLSCSQE